jgi:hypothetical protein
MISFIQVKDIIRVIFGGVYGMLNVFFVREADGVLVQTSNIGGCMMVR